jgi:nitroimidazol reductase NimA-like FMN-containing flavoprotein (pyridoxamine 5'-phosphate oxidase superfamily)
VKREFTRASSGDFSHARISNPDGDVLSVTLTGILKARTLLSLLLGPISELNIGFGQVGTEETIMIEVEELSEAEIEELLGRVGYGHLACSRANRPYVVPVHYAYQDGVIFVYTTEGKKSEIIKENPHVCLQAEEVTDNQHWQSVIVDGVAERITDGVEREKALELIIAVNPSLTPAVSIHWMDEWIRENIEAVYRVTPEHTSGRRAVVRSGIFPELISGGPRDTIF